MALDSLAWSKVDRTKRLLLSKRIVSSVSTSCSLTPRVDLSSDFTSTVSAPPSSPAEQR